MTSRREGNRNAKNLRKAGRAMQGFAGSVEGSAVIAQHKVMLQILRQAKKNAPVDTGALRRSGKVRKLKKGSKVTFGGASTPRHVNYAHFVEYGTMRNPANYFLRKAFKKYQKQLPKAVVAGISKSWNIYARLGSSYR